MRGSQEILGRDAELPNEDSGTIEVHLHELLKKRGMTLAALSQRIGLTIVNLSVLKNGHARAIRFSTLAKLCGTLDCQPGDLLTWHPADATVDRADSTAIGLRPPPAAGGHGGVPAGGTAARRQRPTTAQVLPVDRGGCPRRPS